MPVGPVGDLEGSAGCPGTRSACLDGQAAVPLLLLGAVAADVAAWKAATDRDALWLVDLAWGQLLQTWLDVRFAYLWELACEPLGGDVWPLAGRETDACHCLQQLHGCER